jgi:hypothetical protein
MKFNGKSVGEVSNPKGFNGRSIGEVSASNIVGKNNIYHN